MHRARGLPDARERAHRHRWNGPSELSENRKHPEVGLLASCFLLLATREWHARESSLQGCCCCCCCCCVVRPPRPSPSDQPRAKARSRLPSDGEPFKRRRGMLELVLEQRARWISPPAAHLQGQRHCKGKELRGAGAHGVVHPTINANQTHGDRSTHHTLIDRWHRPGGVGGGPFGGSLVAAVGRAVDEGRGALLLLPSL